MNCCCTGYTNPHPQLFSNTVHEMVPALEFPALTWSMDAGFADSSTQSGASIALGGRSPPRITETATGQGLWVQALSPQLSKYPATARCDVQQLWFMQCQTCIHALYFFSPLLICIQPWKQTRQELFTWQTLQQSLATPGQPWWWLLTTNCYISDPHISAHRVTGWALMWKVYAWKFLTFEWQLKCILTQLSVFYSGLYKVTLLLCSIAKCVAVCACRA